MSIFTKDPLQIIIYKTYGTNTHLYIKGRALEDENINLDRKSFWGILVNSWKRFESDEITHTKLEVTLPNNVKIETITDKDGYFLIDTSINDISKFTDKNGWLQFSIAYADEHEHHKISQNNNFLGEFLIPNKNASFGVISDIDDTILHTGVVSKFKWKLLFNTFFKSPTKRKALEGSAELYQKLQKGKNGKESNPFFYVSHSPWNLYNYLTYFLEDNKFPKGAILLRSMRNVFSRNKEVPEKQKAIVNIIKSYPDLKFILIGDAGEYDAEIYMEVVKSFPKNVKAIILRDVSSIKKNERILNLIKDYKTVPFYLVKSSEEATKIMENSNFFT